MEHDDRREVIATINDLAGWMDFHRQLEAAGNCVRPVRLTGRIVVADQLSGEITRTFNTSEFPGGVLLKACGNRRSTVCVSCASLYRQDARRIVSAGLEGGKGVPASVAGDPSLFVTLTGPSFGAHLSQRSTTRSHPAVNFSEHDCKGPAPLGKGAGCGVDADDGGGVGRLPPRHGHRPR